MPLPDRFRNRIFDVHIHVQPWRQMHPHTHETFSRTWKDSAAIHDLMDDATKLLRYLDQEGIQRAGLVNYVAPAIMGFTPSVNEWVARFASAAPDRLLAIGGLQPLHPRDPGGDVERLWDLGIRMIKIHPPHQNLAPNAYREGNESLAAIYRRAEAIGMPVMVHTGTSVFPGARSRLGDPMLCDDVAIDFPRLTLILAHAGRPLWFDRAFFLTRRHENLHLDLSSIPPGKILDGLPRLAEIADKVLWGTDWPAPGVPGMAANVETFLELPLPPEAQEKILIANANRLFPPG